MSHHTRITSRRKTAKACRKTLAHKAHHAAPAPLSHTTSLQRAKAVAHGANAGIPVAKKAATHHARSSTASVRARVAAHGTIAGSAPKATGLKGRRVAKATAAKSGC